MKKKTIFWYARSTEIEERNKDSWILYIRHTANDEKHAINVNSFQTAHLQTFNKCSMFDLFYSWKIIIIFFFLSLCLFLWDRGDCLGYFFFILKLGNGFRVIRLDAAPWQTWHVPTCMNANHFILIEYSFKLENKANLSRYLCLLRIVFILLNEWFAHEFLMN